MGADSKIEWTDNTFNPWWGCTKVSPGCDNCYAEALSRRYKRAEWGHGKPRLMASESYWRQPLKWSAAANGARPRVFCASMADVFDNEVPEEWRARLFDLIEATPNIDWLLLTKRIGNVLKQGIGEPRDNVWLGISVVNQEEADRDIPKLLRVPARVRFISYEPALGPIYRDNWRGIDWLICGGESGPGARMMQPDWARSIRDQCKAHGVAFFMKQMTKKAPIPEDLLIREFPA